MTNEPLLDAMHSDVRIRALLTHIDAAATGHRRANGCPHCARRRRTARPRVAVSRVAVSRRCPALPRAAARTGDSRELLASPRSDTEIAGRRETRP